MSKALVCLGQTTLDPRVALESLLKLGCEEGLLVMVACLATKKVSGFI